MATVTIFIGLLYSHILVNTDGIWWYKQKLLVYVTVCWQNIQSQTVLGRKKFNFVVRNFFGTGMAILFIWPSQKWW
jgi:hypothetical protein